MNKYIDIGVNLNDDMFKGIYNGKEKHSCDMDLVIKRAFDNNVAYMINLSGNLSESIQNIKLLDEYSNIFNTVGVHPTRCMELENSNNYLDQLIELSKHPKVIALGECGLDFDRLHFCEKHIQIKWFTKFIQSTQHLNKPYIFHMRNSCIDLLNLLENFNYSESIIHCFTGTSEEVKMILDRNLCIGITGCSLRHKDTVDAIKNIPLDRLFIETDSPWCTIKPSFYGYQYITPTKYKEVKPSNYNKESFVKGRQEPAHIIQVYEAVSKILNIPMEDLCAKTFNNFIRVFKL